MRKPPLPVYLLAGVGYHALAYSMLPWLFGRADRKVGWRSDRRVGLSRVGAGLVLSGVLFIAWAVAGHYRAAPADGGLTARPDYLAIEGAYAVSRNPLYIGGMAMWFGWAAVFGSRRATVAGAAWLAALAAVGVPYEERMLRGKFGESYQVYERRVPRWL